jgi:hypothetical protein
MRYLILFLIAGNLAALVVGVLMLSMPQRLASWMHFGRRFSARRFTKPLEVMHETDAVMLRYPRVLGAVMLAGAVFILVHVAVFLSGVSTAEGGRMLASLFGGRQGASDVWEVLWQSLMALVILGALSSLVIGGLAFFKAETLRHWSAAANRWVSMRRALKPLDAPYYGLDRLVQARPRVWGAVITALALYALVVLAWFARAG